MSVSVSVILEANIRKNMDLCVLRQLPEEARQPIYEQPGGRSISIGQREENDGDKLLVHPSK